MDVEELRGKEGGLWLPVLVGVGSFHLRSLNCHARMGKSGVTGYCSVMVEMGSYLGSCEPGSVRAGRPLCYSNVHHFKPHFNLLFSDSLITLNLTETRFAYTHVNFELYTAYNARNHTLSK
jgi:hypothetical protein